MSATEASDQPQGPRPILIVSNNAPPKSNAPQPFTIFASSSLLHLLYEYNELVRHGKEVALFLGDAPDEEEMQGIVEGVEAGDTWYGVLDHPDALKNLLRSREAELKALIDILLDALKDAKTSTFCERGKLKADETLLSLLKMLAEETGSILLKSFAGVYNAILTTKPVDEDPSI